MILTDKEIIKLRSILEEKLKRVPDKKKITIDKDILEQLLFETAYVVIDGKIEDRGCRYIAWSGPFLSKVDLSDISFDNVLWGYYGKYDERFYINNDNKDIYVDLSNTNANIDFSTSARRRYDGYDTIINCNLTKVDLSKTSLGKDSVILNSSLRKTNLVFNNDTIGVFENSDLTGTDMTNVVVTEYSFCTDENGFGPFTILKNTGLNIRTNVESEEEYEDALRLSMSLGNLDGCYLDGELIDSELKDREENRTFINDVDSQIKKLEYKHRK